MLSRLRLGLATGVLATLALTACGSSDPSTDSTGSTDGGASTGGDGTHTVSVVASTNVWGDIAKSVGGNHVTVTSFISDPAQDPHSFEANPQNVLAVKQAGLVIENGGGYDDFMQTLLKSAGDANVPVLNAVDISGKTAPAGGELNEHVWYDLPTVTKVAQQIASTLGTADPAHAADYTANAATFTSSLAPLTAKTEQLKAGHAGAGVAITEPVPGYLLDAAGLVDKTPEEFSEAVEEGGDVAPAVLKQTLDLFSDKQVVALVYNDQTTGPTTESVKKAATDNGIPVVPVTETLPADTGYVPWMSAQIDALARALGQAS